MLALWGSFITHPLSLSVHTSPSVQSQGAVPQDTKGRWKMESAVPSCSSRGRPCPLSPFSPQWVRLIIYESPCHHLEKAMAPHSSTLAWKIPWTEEPGRLQSMGSDTTERLHFHFSLSRIGEGNDNPLQCSCLENPRDGGAWWAAVYGVAQSRTRLKRLSSSSCHP